MYLVKKIILKRAREYYEQDIEVFDGKRNYGQGAGFTMYPLDDGFVARFDIYDLVQDELIQDLKFQDLFMLCGRDLGMLYGFDVSYLGDGTAKLCFTVLSDDFGKFTKQFKFDKIKEVKDTSDVVYNDKELIYQIVPTMNNITTSEGTKVCVLSFPCKCMTNGYFWYNGVLWVDLLKILKDSVDTNVFAEVDEVWLQDVYGNIYRCDLQEV